MPCGGDEDVTCGGDYVNSVYILGNPDEKTEEEIDVSKSFECRSRPILELFPEPYKSLSYQRSSIERLTLRLRCRVSA